ncbi:MAG: hypothetical protein MI784_12335 [Cytophagales bacterium]|nr:hypothetical protein [Cytophagales bacterium]
MNRLGRLLLFFLSIVCLLAVGYYRERFIFNFLGGDFLISRGMPNYASYPMNLEGILKGFSEDPRWLSTVSQLIVLPLGAMGLVYSFFGRKDFVRFTMWLYVGIVVFCSFFVLLSIGLGQYTYGYSLAQQVKDLVQLPFVPVFLLPAFRLYELMEKQQGRGAE